MGSPHHSGMAGPKKPKYRPTFIKSWRKHRGLNQEQLSERVGVTQETISKLERGALPYTQQTLEALAEALRCTPADLMIRDPLQEDPLWSIWDQISPVQRPQAARVLRAFTDKKTGTEG